MLPSSIPGRGLRDWKNDWAVERSPQAAGRAPSTVQSLKNWKTSAYPKYGFQKKRFTGYSNVSKITIRFTENQGLSMDAPSADRTRSSYSLRMSDGTTPWTPLPERCCWMECQVKTKFSIPPDVLPLKWCSKWRKWESPS